MFWLMKERFSCGVNLLVKSYSVALFVSSTIYTTDAFHFLPHGLEMSGLFYQSRTVLINPEEILDFHELSASTAE